MAGIAINVWSVEYEHTISYLGSSAASPTAYCAWNLRPPKRMDRPLADSCHACRYKPGWGFICYLARVRCCRDIVGNCTLGIGGSH
eukprot:1313895-Rhodomonas_salina.6